MNPRSKRLSIAGLIAAAALAVRGVMELREGTGWALLLIATALVAVIAVRHFLIRD